MDDLFSTFLEGEGRYKTMKPIQAKKADQIQSMTIQVVQTSVCQRDCLLYSLLILKTWRDWDYGHKNVIQKYSRVKISNSWMASKNGVQHCEQPNKGIGLTEL